MIVKWVVRKIEEYNLFEIPFQDHEQNHAGSTKQRGGPRVAHVWFRVSACFVYGKTVVNKPRVEKSAFEDQSEENSVWILKWTPLLGIFCKISFTPAVTSCYQAHALNADAHLSAALLCYFWWNRCRNLAAVNCILHWIVLTLSTLQMGITLVIVVAYHCCGYTTITKCPYATTKTA